MSYVSRCIQNECLRLFTSVTSGKIFLIFLDRMWKTHFSRTF